MLWACGGGATPARNMLSAQRRLDRAEHSLEQAEHRTAPVVEAYVLARNHVDHARTDLRHHDLARQLDRYDEDRSVPTGTVSTALHTWAQWANGDTVTVTALAAAVTTLTKPGVDARLHALGDTMLACADAAELWHQLRRPQPPTLEHKGLELGL